MHANTKLLKSNKDVKLWIMTITINMIMILNTVMK
jgi:hypothetical protein